MTLFVVAGMLVPTTFCTIPATCQEQVPAKPPAGSEAAALRALIKRAIGKGEALQVPATTDAEAQEFMNAGRAGGSDVVESNPWEKKRLSKASGFSRPEDDKKLAAGMTVVGMALGAQSDMMSQLISTMPAQERAKMGDLANNLAGLPTNTPCKALRRNSSGATHVFYVLLGSAENEKLRKPLRLVWRQTHGDKAAIASRSIYYVSDTDGRLLDVVEKGHGFQGRPSAHLKNEDGDIAERFQAEKKFWLGTGKSRGPR